MNFQRMTLITILLLFSNIIALSQNEPFRGGIGDGFGFSKSNLIDFNQVNYEGGDLTVTINQDSDQEDPTFNDLIKFTVFFSEDVKDFDVSDIEILSDLVPGNISISGNGNTYTIELSNINTNGDIIVQIPAGVAHNSVGNPNKISESSDNSVTFYGGKLTAEILRGNGQQYYSNNQEMHFAVKFSDIVEDFSNEDISLFGTAEPKTIEISGEGKVYDVKVTGMSKDGIVGINIPKDLVHNRFGKGNEPSINTENEIVADYTKPTVEITQSFGQNDPSTILPLNFNLRFSEEVINLSDDKISFGASVGVYIQVENIDFTNYTVKVFNVASGESIIISLDENTVQDKAGNYNYRSINTDNKITYIGTTSLNNEIEKESIKIYYSDNSIIVKLSNSNSVEYISIYDIMGNLIYFKDDLINYNCFPINKNYTSYVVRVKNGNQFINKIIIPVNKP